MTFLSPFAGLLGAAIAVPLLLALYFLKLRRQMLRIPSTLLWKKSTEDLQVNVPFQRLRSSLLLFLQLLLIASLVAALAQPVLQSEAAPSSRVILLIDSSASMNATDTDELSRLDAAKSAAIEIIERLGKGDSSSQMMIVTFAASAHVVSSFESDRRLLRSAIESIKPTDEQANLEAALELAGAFASREDSPSDQPPTVMLISDGGVALPGKSTSFALKAGELRFVHVGPENSQQVRNVGIVSFSARRDYKDPSNVLVFARLANASSVPIETIVTLRVDGSSKQVERLEIPAASDNAIGEAPMRFDLQLHSGAVLTLSSSYRDDLKADNIAALVVPPPAASRIALIHQGESPDAFIHDLLAATQPQRLVSLSTTPEMIDELRERLESDFDLAVFDRVSISQFPSIPTISFGAEPGHIVSNPPRREGGKRILSWDRQHPIMRHVSLDALVYYGFGGFDLPDDSIALATGPDGPVIALVNQTTARHILVGFEIEQSNWPIIVSNLIFLQNTIDHLTLAGGSLGGLTFSPGQPITARTEPNANQVSITGPTNAQITVTGSSSVTLPLLSSVGIYSLKGTLPPMQQIAISLLSDIETDIRPRQSLTVNAEKTEGGEIQAVAPLPLWPWLGAIALCLLVVEWLVYCGRMHG